MSPANRTKLGIAIVAAAGIGIVAVARLTGYDVIEAANTIVLQGTVAQNCSVEVTVNAGAGSLPLSSAGAQRVAVGTVLQNCNKKTGYTLEVTSQNCSGAPTGAKVVDPVSTEYLAYSGEFQNPTTGGSQASVTGLLAAACGGQYGRNVTDAKVSGETSTVYVNFTGSETLSAGTYQDTLTITMNVK